MPASASRAEIGGCPAIARPTVRRSRSSWSSRSRSREPVSTGSQTGASELALAGIPVFLEVADEGRAQVAVGLLPGEGRHVLAEDIERLLADAEGTAVGGRVDQPRAGQCLDPLAKRVIHRIRLDDLVAQQLGGRDAGLELAPGEDRLTGEAVADRARHAQWRGAGNDPLL